MLHQRDYILRIIEQMVRVLAHILRRIQHGPVEELTEVEGELYSLAERAGLDLELALRLAPEALDLMVSPFGEVDPSRCWLLAELLYLYGLKSERVQQTEAARQNYMRSLHLYRRVQPEWMLDSKLPHPQTRIQDIEARLGELARPASS